MAACPNCRASVEPGDRFCSNCGASLAVRCSSCEGELRVGADFCASCGTPIRGLASSVEHRLVTAIYVDLVGSTGLAEVLDSEDLTAIVVAVHDAVRTEVGAHQGAVGAFVGDGVLGVFGLPAAHEDDATRALRAASAVLRRVAELRAAFGPRFDVDIQVRIGVNTGELLAPSTEEADLGTLAGDVLNVAARLQEIAEPGAVVVSERTARAAPRFRFDDLGLVDVRGRARPIHAFAVAGESDVVITRVRGPLVGREREQRALEDVYRRVVAEGRPHLLTVLGNAGVGKSRLLREFVEWAEREDSGLTTLAGRCLPYGQDITYRPMAEILTDLTGVTVATDPAEAATRVQALVARFATEEDTGIVTDVLLRMIGVEPPSGVPAPSPARTRELLRGTWRDVLSGIAADGPVIVLIEDIHWAGEALLDLLEHVVRRSNGPLLVVSPARPELTEHHPAWGVGAGAATSISLDPLPADDGTRLAARLLADAGLPVAATERIAARADGNPFFIEELVRELAVRRDGGADDELPATIQAVVSARIDLLRPADRRVLQAASVVGRIFWPSAIAHMTQTDDERVDEALGRLESLQLVRVNLRSTTAAETEYLFQHVLIREAAYARLSRRDLAAMHAALADWIRDHADVGPETAERVAFHTFRAHQAASATTDFPPEEIDRLRSTAVDRLLTSAAKARARAALDRSREIADAALTIAKGPIETALVHEQLGLTPLATYDGDAAWAVLRAAVDLPLQAPQPDSEVITRIAANAVQPPLRWRGTMRQAPPMEDILRYVNLGMEHAGTQDSEHLCMLLTALSFAPITPGPGGAAARGVISVDDGREAGLRAKEMAQRLGLKGAESAALDSLQSHALWGGRIQEATDITDARLDLAATAGDPREDGDTYAMAAVLSYDLGETAQARDRALHGFKRTIDEAPAVALYCLNWAMAAQVNTGEWTAVATSLRRAQELLDPESRNRPPLFASGLFAAAAMVAEFRGKTEEATRLMAILTDVWSSSDLATRGGHPHARWTRHLGPVYIRRGDFDTAERFVHSDDANPIGRENARLIVACDLAAAQKDWKTADAAVEEARSTAAGYGLRGLRAHADRLEGLISIAARDPKGGLALLASARASFEALGDRWETARTDLEIAERGGTTDIGASADFFDKIGAVSEAGRARTLTHGALADR